MLTIFGRSRRGHCDGLSRRNFLQIGGLTMSAAALNLSDFDLARADAVSQSGIDQSCGRLGHKAVINVFLAGGPPHQDMWDLKPDAPEEIRGEFRPIATNVPGIEICEVFPRLAKVMDRAAIIRSIVGNDGRHDNVQCFTGYRFNDLNNIGGRPSIGSFASKVLGPVDRAVPPFVGLSPSTRHAPWGDPGKPGFLGQAFAPVQPSGSMMKNMVLDGISLERLNDRRRLLSRFDSLRREIDAHGAVEGVDSNTALAFDVLTSSKLVDALDLSKEDPRVRERYGTGKPFNFQYDGAPTDNEHLLMARRLVEAGVRCVTLSYGRWDSHGKNFDLVRDHGSKLDRCLSALIEDLDMRGILDDVTVIAWGEFGRTPRINKGAGRDHWPQVNAAFLAGGGMKTGQVIGSTNRLGEHAKDRPVHIQEVVATLYHNLGIDPREVTVRDPQGRPQYPTAQIPLPELVG